MRFDIRNLFAAVFAPPFPALPLVVWLYYVWCFLAHPGSQILFGNLPDADDYMYLAQVSDWLNGQSWFDIVQHRLNPPEGVPIDFSRLTQLPMAALILLLRPLLGMAHAGIVMAAILPLVWLAVLFFALRWTADCFMPKGWSRVTVFVALFASYLIYQFSPGHIDHHGLTVVLVTVAFGFAARMIRRPLETKSPIGAGFFLALALAIALETLPWLIVISVWLGLWAMQKGGKAVRVANIFGLTLYLASCFFVIVLKAPHDWFAIDTMAYSVVYVFFTGAIAICFAGIASAAKARLEVRYLVGVVLAVITGFLFLKHFPELIGGPYGAVNAELASLMFDNITEALPIARPAAQGVEIFLRLIWPAMALVVSFVFLRRAQKDDRWLWGLLTFSLAAAVFLATFYQIRCMVFAQLFSIIVMAVALQKGMAWLDKNSPPRAVGLMQIGLLLLIAPLPMLIFPAVVDNRPFNTGILLFPVVKTKNVCDMRSLAQALDNPQTYASRPHLIMNEMDSGSELLFRTPHDVLGAPYHTNVGGNLDLARFFTVSDPTDAKAIMQRRGAELVVICRADTAFYHAPSGQSFAEQLAAGKTPRWLKQIDYPGQRDFLLFEMQPSGKSKK